VKKPLTVEDYRNLILSFAASYTLADNMGDVGYDVGKMLNRIGFDEDWDDQSDLAEKLAAMGVKTMNGTNIGG